MNTIVANGITTPDGTTLYSFYRHDYKGYTDSNGEYYFIDGGHDYVRTSWNTTPAVLHTVYDSDPHERIRQHFHWGTYGKDGEQPLRHIPLHSMETDHIKAILLTQAHIPGYVRNIFERELIYRLQQCFTTISSSTTVSEIIDDAIQLLRDQHGTTEITV